MRSGLRSKYTNSPRHEDPLQLRRMKGSLWKGVSMTGNARGETQLLYHIFVVTDHCS